MADKNRPKSSSNIEHQLYFPLLFSHSAIFMKDIHSEAPFRMWISNHDTKSILLCMRMQISSKRWTSDSSIWTNENFVPTPMNKCSKTSMSYPGSTYTQSCSYEIIARTPGHWELCEFSMARGSCFYDGHIYWDRTFESYANSTGSKLIGN